MIWEGIIDVVSHSSKLGIKTSIYTSGNGQNALNTIRVLAQNGLYKSVFSLYADSEEEHFRITRRIESFKNTIEAINVNNANGVISEIHFVALKTNYEMLPNIVNLAKRNGVHQVSVLRFVPQGRGEILASTDILNREQNIQLQRMIREIRETGFRIRTGSPFNFLFVNDQPKCLAAEDRLIVAPDLMIFPCDAFKQVSASRITGVTDDYNLLTHSLSDCWENSRYFQLVRNAKGKYSEKCVKCSQHMLCLSGCMAQRLIFSGSIDPNCDPSCIM